MNFLNTKNDEKKINEQKMSCLFLLRNKIIFSYKYEASIFDFYY